MKRFAIFIFSIFICTFANGETLNLNWYVDNQVYQTTTCETGGNVTPPTAPNKKGYTFQEWLIYTPIEYIESTGTQYIDTGYLPDNKTNIITQFKTIKVHSNNALFGSRESYANKSFNFWIYGGTCPRLDIGSTQICVASNIVADDMYVLRVFDNNIFLNNVFISNYIDQTYSNYPMFIFNINNGGSTQQTENYTVKIYYFQIYDNNTLVRDFIPVLDANDTPCMYDKVEGKFYYNQGTGQFIAGPVLTE